MQSLKELTNGQPVRLSWGAGLCIFFGTLLIGLLFYQFGALTLVRPTVYSVVVIGFAVAMRWQLRRHAWFWITMIVLVALHVPLILLVPWTTKWIPVFMIVPFAIADLYAMLIVLSTVAKLMEQPKTPEG
jgi:hypothetical protein